MRRQPIQRHQRSVFAVDRVAPALPFPSLQMATYWKCGDCNARCKRSADGGQCPNCLLNNVERTLPNADD